MAVSLSDIIRQNSLGQSEGFPAGVPTSWNWYQGWSDDGAGLKTPPADFTAVEGWGQVYQDVGAPAYSNPNASVEVANAKTYVHLKQTGEWVLVQDQASTQLAGAHFVTDFAGNAGYGMQVTPMAGGGTAFDPPPTGYNDHFWYGARGNYAPGTVDAVYVQMDMRVTDPNLNLVASVGADWWRDANAPYLDDHSNNPGIGSSNWAKLSTQWSTLGYYSPTTTQFQADLPPPLRGSAQTNLSPPPIIASTDTVAPPAPEIVSAAPDTANAGNSRSVTSLPPPSVVGSTDTAAPPAPEIVSAAPDTANAGNSRSVTSLPLPSVVGSTDTAAPPAPEIVSAAPVTDTAGRPSSVTSPPVSGANLLVNGSFEASPVAANRWAGFSSIPGWTALTGGTIELWNNLNNVQATDGVNFGELDFSSARDGFYQTVKTSAGQSYDLSFDARSRPGFTSATTTMEVLWNDSVVAAVPPDSAWRTYNFPVTGTGGQDRLTFREAAGQSADGLGALYDNVSLVPAGSGSVRSVQQSAVSDTSQAMNLVTQYSAVSFPQASVSPVGGLHHSDMSTALGHTLARSHHHKFA